MPKGIPGGASPPQKVARSEFLGDLCQAVVPQDRGRRSPLPSKGLLLRRWEVSVARQETCQPKPLAASPELSLRFTAPDLDS